MQHVYFIWTSILYLQLKVKKKKTTKIRQINAVIFYFQTKYSLYFIIVLNAEKLTYNIQNPRVVHDFRYWLTIQYGGADQFVRL